MKPEQYDQIIRYSEQLDPITDSIESLSREASDLAEERRALRREENALIDEIAQLADEMGLPVSLPDKLDEDLSVLNFEIQEAYLFAHPGPPPGKFPKLTTEEIILSSIAGLIAVAIDIFLVGTPEVVKIYRGGENFDGSTLTAALRKIGNGEDDPISNVLHWLSDKCKVPYDLSCVSGVVTPNNHRLRSLGHDPLFGLFFAVADIFMGTTTCIDNKGMLRVLANYQVPMSEKLLSVFYYIGHLLSDICTARGLPIPGFFLTQFFTDGGSDKSIARIAEGMYQDGYDLRHLASMSTPVAVKSLLIDCYLSLTKQEINPLLPVAEREYVELQHTLKREEMHLIADAIAVGGNVVKIFAPPNLGNPCALNIAEWFSLVRHGFSVFRSAVRDRTAETIIEQRSAINSAWDRLLKDS